MMRSPNNIPRAIIFFGPDGSGKTTQANLLVSELNRKGIRNKKLWLRSLHTLAFIISKVSMHILRLNDIYQLRTKYSHHAAFRITWYIIEFVSILPLILTRFYLPLLQGYVIVAERFVIDWVVSVAYATNNPSLVDSWFATWMTYFIPKQSVLVYIDAEYNSILSRRGAEDSFESIEFQRVCYSKFAQKLHALQIDSSNKGICEVFAQITDFVFCENKNS
jgi:thymidylate kinase